MVKQDQIYAAIMLYSHYLNALGKTKRIHGIWKVIGREIAQDLFELVGCIEISGLGFDDATLITHCEGRTGN